MVDNNYFQRLLENRVLPLEEEEKHIKYVVNRMTKFMHNNDITIKETTVGGSFGKHTMIRGRGEVDIVYEIKNMYSDEVYDDLKRDLLTYAQGEFNNNPINVKNYGLELSYRGINVDVLLTFPFNDPTIFLNERKDFSKYKPYRIHLQTDFILKKDQIFHNYVRLLKYWRDLGINSQWKELEYLKSFLIELLAAFVYNSSSNKRSYTALLKEFFIMVDEAITKEKQITFSDYYSANKSKKFKFWTVNDPADPSYNVVPLDLNLNRFQNYCQYSKNRVNENKWEKLFNFTI